MLLDSEFWKDALERAVKTIAQVLLAFLGADVVDVLGVDWGKALGVALGAAVVSLLTSVASAGIGQRGTASLID